MLQRTIALNTDQKAAEKVMSAEGASVGADVGRMTRMIDARLLGCAGSQCPEIKMLLHLRDMF